MLSFIDFVEDHDASSAAVTAGAASAASAFDARYEFVLCAGRLNVFVLSTGRLYVFSFWFALTQA